MDIRLLKKLSRDFSARFTVRKYGKDCYGVYYRSGLDGEVFHLLCPEEHFPVEQIKKLKFECNPIPDTSLPEMIKLVKILIHIKVLQEGHCMWLARDKKRFEKKVNKLIN